MGTVRQGSSRKFVKGERGRGSGADRLRNSFPIPSCGGPPKEPALPLLLLRYIVQCAVRRIQYNAASCTCAVAVAARCAAPQYTAVSHCCGTGVKYAALRHTAACLFLHAREQWHQEDPDEAGKDDEEEDEEDDVESHDGCKQAMHVLG